MVYRVRGKIEGIYEAEFKCAKIKVKPVKGLLPFESTHYIKWEKWWKVGDDIMIFIELGTDFKKRTGIKVSEAIDGATEIINSLREARENGKGQ